MEIVSKINEILGIVFMVCYAYQFFFILIPFIVKDKPHKPTVPHRFGVLISARNEEAVIKNLIDSIKNQTYDSNLVTVFVVADNCTDNTAKISKDAGAVVYERFNTEQVGKGYALEFLYEKIVQDYGDSYFDAYMIFDADNVLDNHYIEEMNKTLSDGYEVSTSYRNSKNYGDNWISAGYGLWFLRESKYLNYARRLLNTSCAVSGTGFMFSSAVIREAGGWKFFLLTEDIEFTIYNVLKGRKIGYCKDAHLYDEQPTSFIQSWHQRMRWAKGYIQVWAKYGLGLLKNIFSPKFTSCYDMTMTILPALVISVAMVLNTTIGVLCGLILQLDVIPVLLSFAQGIGASYVTLFIIGAITVITEWKHIHCKAIKKIFYTFTFPIFMLTYVPITMVAIVKKVEWKPVRHTRARTLDDIKQDKKEEKEAETPVA